MKLAALSTILALLAVEITAQASGSCKSGVIDIQMSGDNPSGGPQPSYTLSVPEDGRSVPITNPIVVFAIGPPYYPLTCPTNCTFAGAGGYINYYDGNTIDVQDGPAVQVQVSCTTLDAADALCISATSLSPSEEYHCTATAEDSHSVPHSTTLPSTTSSTASSAAPPYLTTIGFATAIGTVGPSASASLSPIATGGPLGSNGSALAFTGGAGRIAGSIGSSLLAFFGLVAAF